MAVYPDSIIIEAYFLSRIGKGSLPDWYDISQDVILTQKCRYGIIGNKPTDRIASTGNLSFSLKNDSSALGGENSYLPNSPNFLGLKIGSPVRVKITYDGVTYTKFYGHIANIEIDQSGYLANRLSVTALDWFDYAAGHKINLSSVEYNKKIDEAVTTIISGMPIQPLGESFQTGIDTFPTVFDALNSNTKVTSELTKIALSELGYIYIKRDKANGEQLIVESRHTRNLNHTLGNIPIGTDYSGRILTEDSFYLLTEDGSFLVLDEIQEAVIDEGVKNVDINYGNNILNNIQVVVYPRRVDTTEKVLFALQSPLSLAVAETKTFKGTFRDPDGSTKITGIDMVAPVATTDYLMYSNSNGTGTNLTANLSVTAGYGAEGVEYTLENTGLVAGYVTKLQARGKGIYLYDPLEYSASDTTSINAYGDFPLKVDMKYQADTTTANSIADILLTQNKQPKLVVEKVSFLANHNDLLLQAFLNRDIGDMVYISDSLMGIDGYYHIQAIEFELNPGGIIEFSWSVLETLSMTETYWILDTSLLGSETIVGY